jgi:radial spoke head protein 4A
VRAILVDLVPTINIASDIKDIQADIPAWSIRSASILSPSKYVPVFLRSNRWPGAFSVGYNDKFANIYVGSGHKELNGPFISQELPATQVEFGVELANAKGPGTAAEVTEAIDPTVDEETAFNAAKKGDGTAGDNEEEDQEDEEEEDA